VADLAGGDEPGHGSHGLLDGHGAVHAVLVVEVDVVHAQALEGGVAGGADVVRPTVDADPAPVGETLVAELRGELDLVAAAGHGPAHELLVGEGPYMSAVSRKVTPRSSARWMVSMPPCSSGVP
jgi:hypothetical protein